MIRFPVYASFMTASLLLASVSFARAGQLLHQDFNGPDAWPQFAAASMMPKAGVQVSASRDLVGTIDVADSTTPSGAALLSVGRAETGGVWSAALTSGLLPVKTKEANLGKLTLSFDHSVSSVRPVTVQIESFDANKKRTGGREGIVYPAAADFYVRAALELSTMQAFGAGTFRSTDPYVKITFQISHLPAGATEADKVALRIDNVAYASPAFYVSPNGSDKNDGRTEKTAFADPQKAANAAHPGDIILLMDGTYHRTSPNTVQEGIVSFPHGGTSAAWVVLKNYPGQQPIFESDSWNAIKIGRGNSDAKTTESALGYIEVRGLHIRGNADIAKTKYAEFIGKSSPWTNGNGISVDGRYEAKTPHHVRIADNIVEYCCGGGITALEGDWITAENNIVRNNAWWTIYACSGISFLTTANFDAADNIYKDLIRNNHVSGNQCFVMWEQIGKFSDGNGIIIDSNYEPAKNMVHRGRTMVANNLSFANGGSGIHAYKSHRVDIINNTAYYNGASPALGWGQIFVQVCDDAHLLNNILVSRPNQPINSVGRDGGDQNSTNVIRASNIYFGGLAPKLMGDNDLIADPLFINPSLDDKAADFHVRSGSPALKSGWQGSLVPMRDLDGKPRPAAASPDRGAYQN